MSKEKYIGVFDDEESFEQAIRKIKESKIDIEEVYMPLPIHHAVKDITGGSRMPLAAYFYGLAAMVAIPSFLYYAAVISWPLNFGGKPTNAFPSFIIITLVLTILTVTILSLFTFALRAKLYPGKKAVVYDERALDNKFILVLDSDKVPDAENILKQHGAIEVIHKNQEIQAEMS
jgi:hypothetical protein